MHCVERVQQPRVIANAARAATLPVRAAIQAAPAPTFAIRMAASPHQCGRRAQRRRPAPTSRASLPPLPRVAPHAHPGSPVSAPNLIPHIRTLFGELRPAEQKVADLVLDDVDFALHASITELARRAAVSEPSVTRFCRAVGTDGLRDFKVKLAQSLAGGLPYSQASIERDDTTATLVDKVFRTTAAGIQHAGETLRTAELDAAIRAISTARRVIFLGVGSGSGLVIQDALLRFLRLDIPASAFSDAHLQRLHAGLVEPGDVVFAISHAGRSEEVNDSIRIARKRGATTIALTNAGAPLVALVDIPVILHLPTAIDPNTPGVSRIVQLCVIDAIAVGVTLTQDGQVLEKIRRAKAALHANPSRKPRGAS
jgi:RpiR family transcriptional regulator, carbohydrate utilization regulator